MNISKKVDGSTLSIALDGRLDTMTAPQLEEAIRSSLEGITKLILDFEKLEYVSSAGLRVILSSQKLMRNQGRMVVSHVCEDILEVFRITGFLDILTIE